MKTHYSCADLAAFKLPGTPVTERAWRDLVDRESWSFIEQKSRGRGGMKRLFAPPPAVLKAIRQQEQAAAAVANPSGLHKVMRHAMQALRDIEVQESAKADSKQARAEAFLQALSGLDDHEAASLKAHCEIAEGWQVWFVKRQPMKKSHSWAPFAQAWEFGEVPASKAVREAYPAFSARSAQRWVGEYEQGNFAALIDHRNGNDKRGKTIFSQTPLLAAYAKKLLLERPGIKTEFLHQLLETAAVDAATGEVLYQAPSYHQVYRFQKDWIAKNSELYLQQTNPDAWKNSAMLAYGSASEDVKALNQRWEMDATPADWLLMDTDGKKRRYTASAVIDVYSRRAIVVLARTPKTQTHCFALRLALLAWGVPQQIVTDNGADYQSEHFKRVLKALDIDHRTTAPFSGEEKPHVERFIGTLNHSILELLPNYAGHNVAERKKIEARRSFAERLARKGEIVDFADVLDGSCTGEFLQARINEWLIGIYEQREHGGIGTSPFLRAAGWSGAVRRIADERSLDTLLARPAARGGRCSVQKKGILLNNAWFIAPALARIQVGHLVDVFETEDLGRIVVHYEGEFVCVAECPERTGVNRAEIAAMADVEQKTRLKEARQRVKAETKGAPDTDDLVARHLREKAAAAGKLAQPSFARAEHVSHGLEQASKANRAMDGVPERADSMVIGGVVLPNAAQPKAEVLQLPKPLPRTERPVADNYAEWLVVGERIASGEEVSHADHLFHQRWPGSSQAKAYFKFNGITPPAPERGVSHG